MAMSTDFGLRLRAVRPRIAAGALVLLGLGGGGVVEAADGAEPVVIVDVSPGMLDAETLRAAIGDELGVAAVSPWDPRAPASRGIIRVRIDDGKLDVEYEERHTIGRRVAAPTSASAIVKTAALLAGNLARHEASDLASLLSHETLWPTPSVDAEADEPPPPKADKSESELPRVWLSAWTEADVMKYDGMVHTVLTDGTVEASHDGPNGVGFNGRVLIGADYAMSARWLIGVHAGFMANRYPGPLGSGVNVGRFHLEGRSTFIFEAIDRSLAPYVISSVGVANFDAESDGGVLHTWISRGPIFVTAGLGLRILFSNSVAIMFAPLKGTLAFPTETGLAWSPEFALSVGL
jgi:hypothetical protein